MKKPSLLLLPIILTFAAQAMAKPVTREVQSIPFRTKASHRFEKHQYATSNFSILEDGTLVAKTQFENGKKLDGDHFCCWIELFDAEMNRIAVARQTAGLNAAGLGKPKKRTISAKTKIRPDKLSEIKYVRFTYSQPQGVDDLKFWNDVKQKARVTAEVIVAIKTGNFAILKADYLDNQKLDGSPLKTRNLKSVAASSLNRAR